MDGLEANLEECRRILLKHGVVGITTSPSRKPNFQQFWQFSTTKILDHRGIRKEFSEALSGVYSASLENAIFPYAPLVAISREGESMAHSISIRLNIERDAKDVVIFDEGILRGSSLYRRIEALKGEGKTVVGVFSPLYRRYALDHDSTPREIAQRCNVPYHAAVSASDLAGRLFAFDRHLDFLPPEDPRRNLHSTMSEYIALRATGNIAGPVFRQNAAGSSE